MPEELSGETTVKPKVTHRGGQTGGSDQKLVPLLEPGFSLSDPRRDVARQNLRERVFVQTPLSGGHFGDVTEFFAVTNDPAPEFRDETRGPADEKAPLRFQRAGNNALKRLPDIFRHAVFALIIIAVYANCSIEGRLHGQGFLSHP